MDPVAPSPWWQDAPALARVVRDLLAAELSLARPGRVLPPAPWPGSIDLGADLGADSLDLMAAATALGDLFGMTNDAGGGLLAARTLDGWIAARAPPCPGTIPG
ncbi:hypothetical protein [Massilia sp. Se16.2.3]|uniref:hypothetical protein n=1 Tax=Massilia sp. Se16.2.3 TaxID=2709303 RepID=UPI001E2ADEE0|nr:hypothetical protein [Massilia sp. Se16.2.3]